MNNFSIKHNFTKHNLIKKYTNIPPTLHYLKFVFSDVDSVPNEQTLSSEVNFNRYPHIPA